MRISSGVEKANLNTPVRKEVLEAFRGKCAEMNIPMNVVVELFMEAFSDDRFEIILGNKKYNNSAIYLKEDK